MPLEGTMKSLYVVYRYRIQSMDNIHNITKMYDKETYFDQYGGSVILFIVITIVVIVLVSYFHVMTRIQPIIDDWPNQRCKPTIMPFAGLITHPEGVTASEYTAQNFTYCTQNILSSITGDAVQPLTFITSVLQSMAMMILEAIQAIRAMFDKIRNSMQAVTEEVMGRLLNVMIPLQQIIIGFRDLVGKIQGTMTAGLFTLLGSYYTLKALMGAIAQFIIIILIALAAMIAMFWIFPFTWGAAIANTAIFVALAIPMAIILAFMSDVLHVQPGGGLQIPSIKCFDPATLLAMHDGTERAIRDVEVNDVLADGARVSAKIRVTVAGSQMYQLHDVLVSDSHIVFHEGAWIPVRAHPDAVRCDSYTGDHLYCLNTNTKEINIRGTRFTDWDELYGDRLDRILRSMPYYTNQKAIHVFFDKGFSANTMVRLQDGSMKRMDEIHVDDVLEHGEKVYGTVVLDGLVFSGYHLGERRLYHLLTDRGSFHMGETMIKDYNDAIERFLQ